MAQPPKPLHSVAPGPPPPQLLRSPSVAKQHGNAASPNAHIQAAISIQKIFRGSQAREEAEELYDQERQRLLVCRSPKSLGLGPYALEWPATRVTDYARAAARHTTKGRLWEQLGCPLETMPSSEVDKLVFEECARYVLLQVAEDRSRLPLAVRRQLQKVTLFVGTPEAKSHEVLLLQRPGGRRKDTQLLGHLDVLAVPCTADFDAAFAQIPAAFDAEVARQECDGPSGFSGWFWVFHAAAPNIGENAQAEDFMEYSTFVPEDSGEGSVSGDSSSEGAPKPTPQSPRCCWKSPSPRAGNRRLDADLYVAGMGQLWRNALIAMEETKLEEVILFPLGLGAFLRHLGANDPRYLDQCEAYRLRLRVATELMEALVARFFRRSSNSPALVRRPSSVRRVHFCLCIHGAESIDNHNAFLEAAAATQRVCPFLMELLHFCLNVDCFQLAHELSSSSSPGSSDANGGPRLRVGMLNAANKKLLGNHWFQTGAGTAMDENVHRRSSSLSRAALLLNFDFEIRPRVPQQLQQTIRWLGGTVSPLGAVATPSSSPRNKRRDKKTPVTSAVPGKSKNAKAAPAAAPVDSHLQASAAEAKKQRRTPCLPLCGHSRVHEPQVKLSDGPIVGSVK